MEAKLILEQMTERLERSFIAVLNGFTIETDLEARKISLHFPSVVKQIPSTFLERFRGIVGDISVYVWEDHIELFGYPPYVY